MFRSSLKGFSGDESGRRLTEVWDPSCVCATWRRVGGTTRFLSLLENSALCSSGPTPPLSHPFLSLAAAAATAMCSSPISSSPSSSSCNIVFWCSPDARGRKEEMKLVCFLLMADFLACLLVVRTSRCCWGPIGAWQHVCMLLSERELYITSDLLHVPPPYLKENSFYSNPSTPPPQLCVCLCACWAVYEWAPLSIVSVSVYHSASGGSRERNKGRSRKCCRAEKQQGEAEEEEEEQEVGNKCLIESKQGWMTECLFAVTDVTSCQDVVLCYRCRTCPSLMVCVWMFRYTRHDRTGVTVTSLPPSPAHWRPAAGSRRKAPVQMWVKESQWQRNIISSPHTDGKSGDAYFWTKKIVELQSKLASQHSVKLKKLETHFKAD